MPATEHTTDSFDPFSQWRAMRDSTMDSWSKAMLDFVHSDAYASASARWLDAYLSMSQSFQNVMDETMTQTMTQLKIPTTDDIKRLSDRIWSVELKLDDLDARADEIVSMLKELAARPVAPPAPTPQAPSPAPAQKAAAPSEPTTKATVAQAAPAPKAAHGPPSATTHPPTQGRSAPTPSHGRVASPATPATQPKAAPVPAKAEGPSKPITPTVEGSKTKNGVTPEAPKAATKPDIAHHKAVQATAPAKTAEPGATAPKKE